jgi:NADH pyrophosphatase NudC (nudix superfamily)
MTSLRIGFCPGCGSEIDAVLRDEAWVGHRCSECGATTYPVIRGLSGARDAAAVHERNKLVLLPVEKLRSKLTYLAAGLDHAELVHLVMEALSLPQRDLSPTTQREGA